MIVLRLDIKLENFLVKYRAEDDQLEIKLSDFGVACKYTDLERPSDKKGSLVGVAPEILT